MERTILATLSDWVLQLVNMETVRNMKCERVVIFEDENVKSVYDLE
jgi:hypothetical protein